MKDLVILLFTVLVPGFASAATLTYQFDAENSRLDIKTAARLCGMPLTIQLDAKEDLATVAIQKTQNAPIRDTEIDFIQASEGGYFDPNAKEPYNGDYRVKVAITRLKSSSDRHHPKGYYRRVEVTTYGSKSAPKGFTIDSEMLNYRESAEMAEDSICTGASYYLSSVTK